MRRPRAGRKILMLSAFALIGLVFLLYHSPSSGSFWQELTGSHDKEERYSFIMAPEYQRSLSTILISLSHQDFSLKHQKEILRNLPAYTRIIILTPKDHLSRVKEEIRATPYRDRVRLVPYDAPVPEEASYYLLFREKDKLQQGDIGRHDGPTVFGSIWAQDFLEVAKKKDGTTALLIPPVYKYYFSARGHNDEVERDNQFLFDLADRDLTVQGVPITFKGGNILFDELHGQTLMLCGSDVLKTTRTIWQVGNGEKLTAGEMTAMFKKILNVDEVVILGKGKLQPDLMYHLDQAILPLGNGTIGVARLEGMSSKSPQDPEIRAVLDFLDQTRKELTSLGYRIIDIRMSKKNLLKYQHYVNAIPFTDWQTNEKRLLMPVFPDNQTADDRKLVTANTRTLEELGYRVTKVATQANRLKGGIHCLVNVLE